MSKALWRMIWRTMKRSKAKMCRQYMQRWNRYVLGWSPHSTNPQWYQTGEHIRGTDRCPLSTWLTGAWDRKGKPTLGKYHSDDYCMWGLLIVTKISSLYNEKMNDYRDPKYLSLTEREGRAGRAFLSKGSTWICHQWWQKLVPAPPDTMLLNTFLLRLPCQNI